MSQQICDCKNCKEYSLMHSRKNPAVVLREILETLEDINVNVDQATLDEFQDWCDQIEA